MGKELDPFAAVSLHGLWPLVQDTSSPAGIRFADLATDGPGDCLVDAGRLPPARIELRTFRDGTLLDGWSAAAREFGGNALAVVPGPSLAHRNLRFALVVRFDIVPAERAPDLDDAISLVRDMEGPPGDLAAFGSETRAQRLASVDYERSSRAWSEGWKREIEAVAASGLLAKDHTSYPPPAYLPVRTLKGRPASGRVERVADGLLVSFRISLPAGADADLDRRFREAVESRGWSVGPEGTVRRTLAALDASTVPAIARDAEHLSERAEEYARLKESRAALIALHLDPEALRILRRMAQGVPLVSVRYREPAAQFSPRTAKAATVAASRVERLFLNGLVAPVWWREPTGRPDPRRGPAPIDWNAHIVWGLTPTGTAFLSGGMEDAIHRAAETQASDAATALAWLRGSFRPGVRLPVPHAGLDAAVAGLPAPGDDVVRSVAAALDRERLGAWFPAGANLLAIAAAGLAAGLLESDGRNLSRKEGQTPAP